jgi:Ni2+-binding GTPase involved in maturation of urease and hydrogenase
VTNATHYALYVLKKQQIVANVKHRRELYQLKITNVNAKKSIILMNLLKYVSHAMAYALNVLKK